MLDLENVLVRRAYEIALEAHKGQKDKAGAEYILHPVYVASHVGEDTNAMVVALLHDVVEDTDVTLGDLSKEFPSVIVEAVSCMTHDKDEAYLDYIRRIKQNPLACVVKKADLAHNMDLTRFSNPSDKDRERIEHKYKPALRILSEI